MIDKIRIWNDDSGNVHYEVKDKQDTPFMHVCMSQSEWNALRNKTIESYPAGVQLSTLTDYLAVLMDVVFELA